LIHFLFFFTPIVYSHTRVPKSIEPFVFLNPMMPVIVSYRELFLNGTFNVTYWAISIGTGLLLVAVGYSVYHRLKWKFAELL